MTMFKGVIAGLMVSPSDPIYFFGLRRVKWAATPAARRNYQRFVIALLLAMVFAIWLGLADFLIDVFDLQDGIELATGVLVVTFAGGILMNLFLDFGCLLFAINSINGEHISGRWDLLCLSLLTEDDIIQAKYALAQVRAWRVMVFIRAMRIVSFIVFLLLLFVVPFIEGDGDDLWVSIADFFVESPYEAFISLAILMTFWGYYLIDPVWRLRALTAVGIAVSARTRRIVFAILLAFAAMLAVWFLQAVLTGLFFWIVSLMFRDSGGGDAAAGLTVWLFFQSVFIVGTYLFYSSVRDFSLRKALLWAFRE
ncbi:MAG: hypothetical protein D6737_02260 [Chloroflexi bacterium]|nr:MAG: hypothetical protein D6737_02260 [Chloroflexota bacterium]